jgi:hypothetical protein
MFTPCFMLQLGVADLPEHVESGMLEDDEFLQKFHHALLEVLVSSSSFERLKGQSV